MEEIKTEEYSVVYDPSTATICCKGSLLLNGADEYAPILQLLNKVAERQVDTLTLDLRALEFLNSSGINTVTRFVINVRNNKNSSFSLVTIGDESVPWQVRLLKNLQRLMPSLTLNFE
jgi:hypothetical protein